MLEFIDLVHQSGERLDGHTSFLQINKESDEHPDPPTLQVGGIIPHGARISPRTRKDAERLIVWLQAQIDNNHIS